MILKQSLIRLFTVIGLCASMAEASSAWAQSPSSLQWMRAEVKEGAATGWFRMAVDPSVSDSDSVRLTIVSDQHVSLYVNGQKILKNHAFAKSDGSVTANGFEVKSLIRQGRNLIAVEVNGEGPKASFGLSVTATKQSADKSIGGSWKVAPAMPPVGWQQTDFNDRDWPEAKSVTDEPGDRFRVSETAEFKSPVIPAKSRVAPFQFEDGDRVVFVGATFFERAQLFEHLESTLTATLGEKHVTFRNLGWDGDTVYADSRGIFDRPEVGYLRMIEHIRAEEPTVAFICYGQNEALTPGMTVEKFTDQLEKLLSELEASGIACVLLSPHELLPATPPVPSPSRFNGKIKVYAAATAAVAKSRGLLYIDLMSQFTQRLLEIDGQLSGGRKKSQQEAFASLSENGVHLSDHGYRCASLIVRERLLNIPAEATGMESQKYEQLRGLVRRKNELYFHRWRPQNITYLFGFRKHEQGNNAADIAKFDPFIQDLEKQIHDLQ